MSTQIDQDIENAVQDQTRGLTYAGLIALLGASLTDIRAAVERLSKARKIDVARYPGSRTHYIRKAGTGLEPNQRLCRVCKVVFEPPKKSKRTTCSRSCAVSMGWDVDPERKRERNAAISHGQKTGPNRNAGNRSRWADPEQRRRMSELNKAMWADPIEHAKRSIGIKLARSRREDRAAHSARMKARWASPEGRAKMTIGIRRSKSTPEARAKFSELLRERWKDPVIRAKYIAGQDKCREARHAAASRAMKQQWARDRDAMMARTGKAAETKRRKRDQKKS